MRKTAHVFDQLLVLSFGRKGWQGKKDVGEDSEVEQKRRAEREK